MENQAELRKREELQRQQEEYAGNFEKLYMLDEFVEKSLCMSVIGKHWSCLADLNEQCVEQ